MASVNFYTLPIIIKSNQKRNLVLTKAITDVTNLVASLKASRDSVERFKLQSFRIASLHCNVQDEWAEPHRDLC